MNMTLLAVVGIVSGSIGVALGGPSSIVLVTVALVLAAIAIGRYVTSLTYDPWREQRRADRRRRAARARR
jgi:hypothetical protein